MMQGVYTVTGTNVHFDFPVGVFYVVEPCVFVTLYGAPTDIDVALNYVTLNNASVFASLDLTFKSSDIGKKFSLMLVSND